MRRGRSWTTLTPDAQSKRARKGIMTNHDGQRRNALEVLAYDGVDFPALRGVWPELSGVLTPGRRADGDRGGSTQDTSTVRRLTSSRSGARRICACRLISITARDRRPLERGEGQAVDG